MQSALSKALDPETRTAIAIAVSQVNKCNYCLKAHCYVALKDNTSPGNDILLRDSYDANKRAAAEFAAKVVELRGHVADEDLKAVRGAGFKDSQILEIIALSVQFLMTNFMNNVALTDIDVELDQV
ncbi:MAG TPA: carboxymuconolactone decarboxylase family protein [Pirellulales bacterium]